MDHAKSTKRDQIVDGLRRQILSGEFPRGARMPQDRLAAQFGASITPVREALRLLESEGLVVAEPHRGVRVAAVDLDQVKATYVLRRLTESYAMRRALFRTSRRDLVIARSMLTSAAPDGPPSSEQAREDNRAFHFYFYERCGLPALTQRIDGMWRSFPWDLMLNSAERSRQSLEEHLSIVEAMESGDADAVARATECHIANGFSSILRQITGEEAPDPFTPEAD